MGAVSGSIAAAAGRRVAMGAAVCSGTVVLVAGGYIAVVVDLSTSKGARARVDASSAAVGGIALAEVVEAVEAVGARRVFALPRVPINEGKRWEGCLSCGTCSGSACLELSSCQPWAEVEGQS